MGTIDVSVVIVCMNNYGQLKDCLDSIKKYTHNASYEVLLVAYFFSEENGFTDADNIDADTICVQLSMHKQLLAQPVEEPKKNKKSNAPELSPLVYNLPGNAAIQVTYKNRNLAKRTLPIAQLGVDVPLAKDLFKGDKLPVIVISEKTGSILSISK